MVDDFGEIREEAKIENTKENLEKFASEYQGAKAVIEATSNYRFIYDVLENHMDVKLAHPYKTRVIAEARIKNRVHAILARNGIFDYPNPFTKKGREYIETLDLSETDRRLLEINLTIIDKINEEIKEIDKIIQERAKQDNDALLLTTIPGISYYSALLIKSEIGDINRFPNKFKLISYAGLCPPSDSQEIRKLKAI